MKRLPWFRMFYEARNDAKLRTLSDKNFRIWFNLLCLAAEQGDRGEISAEKYPGDLLAIEVSAGDEVCLNEALYSLERLRIISRDDDGITFIHFMERQYDKPSDYPENTRARKQKERDKSVTEEPVTPVSRDVTRNHAQEKSREEKNREEEKRETLATENPPRVSAKPLSVRDPLWDALVEEMDATPETLSERGAWNKAAKELRDAGATAADIHVRAKRYRAKWPGVDLTPVALAKHWGLFAHESAPRPSPNGRNGHVPPPQSPMVDAYWSDVQSEAKRWHPGEREPTFVRPVMDALASLGGWESFMRGGARREAFVKALQGAAA